MDETFYIRVRGRVQGPFDREKLQQMARRGQLSRIHEISPDGNMWRKAGEYPALFATTVTAVVTNPKADDRTSAVGIQAVTAPTAPAEPQWHFACNGNQHGPVRFLELQRLAAMGQLSPTDSVWREGMADWTLAQNVPGLIPTSNVGSTTEASRQETNQREDDERTGASKLSGSISRSAADAQVWVMFIAIIGYIYAGLMFASGMVLLVGVADNELNAGFLGTVLMWFLYAGVLITGSILLNSYHSAMNRFVQSRSEAKLDQALRRLRTFWVFVGIVLIVITVNLIVGAILVFSAAASVTDFMT